MDRLEELLARKYEEILEGAQEMKELREAATILMQLRELNQESPQNEEEMPRGGIVELG